MKLSFLSSFILLFSCQNSNNLENLSRVERAYFEKKAFLLKHLESKNIHPDQLEIFFRAFKKEQVLEIWAKNKTDQTFQKLIEYDFCAFSGDLGPKRKEGDRQIPEGVYFINRFNPKSKFHLSLGLNYPNDSDKILSDKNAPGSDIFIHGGCQTIGCIPLTDDKIREVWVLSEWAKKYGQSKIPVHIFPFQMTKNNLEKHSKTYPKFESFWKNLMLIFEAFENTNQIPSINVSEAGKYQF